MNDGRRRTLERAGLVVIVLGFGGTLGFLAALLLGDVPLAYRLDCDRVSGECEIERRLLLGARRWTVTLDSIRGVEVHHSAPRRGTARVLLVLVTGGPGPTYVADYGHEGRVEAERAAARVNAFLRDASATRLTIERDDTPWYWTAWTAMPFASVMVIALVLAARRVWRTAR